MRKKLLLPLLLCMVLFCIACGKEAGADTTTPVTGGQTDDETVVTDTSDTEDEVVSTEEENKSSIELSQICKRKTSEGDMYINVPDWQEVEKGYTRVYKVGGGIGGNYYVAWTIERGETASTAKEAYPLAFDCFKESVSSYGHPNSLTIESEEEMTINGLDVYRFQGILNCKFDSETSNPEYMYAVGYSFVWYETPCMIIGVVQDEDQHQEFIDTVTEAVDAMIYTVRSEK